MAGEQQRHGLVAHLAVRQARAVLVGGLEQHAEDVARRPSPVAAAALDLGVHDPVEHLARAGIRRHGEPGPRRMRSDTRSRRRTARARIRARPRPPPRSSGSRPSSARMAIRIASSRAHAYTSTASPERQPRGPRSASSTIVSAAAPPVAVEGGQHDPPRATVVVAVGGQQSVAEQRISSPKPVAPAKVARRWRPARGGWPRARAGTPGARAGSGREHGPVALVARAARAAGRSPAVRAAALKSVSPGGKEPLLGKLDPQVSHHPRDGLNVSAGGTVAAIGRGYAASRARLPARGASVRLGLALPPARMPARQGRRPLSGGATWESTPPR